jgi:hypothetical protein
MREKRLKFDADEARKARRRLVSPRRGYELPSVV